MLYSSILVLKLYAGTSFRWNSSTPQVTSLVSSSCYLSLPYIPHIQPKPKRRQRRKRVYTIRKEHHPTFCSCVPSHIIHTNNVFFCFLQKVLLFQLPSNIIIYGP